MQGTGNREQGTGTEDQGIVVCAPRTMGLGFVGPLELKQKGTTAKATAGHSTAVAAATSAQDDRYLYIAEGRVTEVLRLAPGAANFPLTFYP